MGAAKEIQLTYIKGLMCDLDPVKIKEVEERFGEFIAFCDTDEELEAIGVLVIARFAIEQDET